MRKGRRGLGAPLSFFDSKQKLKDTWLGSLKMTLRNSFAITGLLAFLLLIVSVVRQVSLSTGMGSTETDLAMKMLGDFLASPAALLDVGFFLISAIFLHAYFALIAAVLVFAVIKPGKEGDKTFVFPVFSFFFLLLVVLVWDSIFFPLTLSGFLKFSSLSSHTVAVTLSVMVVLGLILGAVRLFLAGSRLLPTLAVMILIVTGLAFVNPLQKSSPLIQSAEAKEDRPNIIIIGIDALRPDHLGVNGYEVNLTPNIDKFLKESLYFEQAFTPIARTYTAWFSLLSGKAPKTTGIRYNLQEFEKGQLSGNELQTLLKREGYHTIYGMDERRFNNIDERYGFDRDVGPDIGAADFILFHASEWPLVALVSNTPMGEWLFPLIYGNRGVHGTYMPETFTKEVMEAVSEAPNKPLFLALHLTLPHWPYLYREFEPLEGVSFDPNNQFHYGYQMMLKEVDAQFANILDGLEHKGILDNSLIFMISDHGEGFMLESDALKAGNHEIEFPTEAYGHGTNVLDEEQYRIVLGVQDRINNEIGEDGARSDALVSMLDIAPTITQYLDISDESLGFEGESLFDVAACDGCAGRSVFMESSVATNAMYEDDLDVARVMAEGIGFYTVDSDGLAIIRDEVGQMLGMKQRAVIDKDHIVAHFPGLEKDFLIVDREQGIWWPSSQYGGDKPQKVLSLMRDLCSYFDGDSGFDTNGLCRGAVN